MAVNSDLRLAALGGMPAYTCPIIAWSEPGAERAAPSAPSRATTGPAAERVGVLACAPGPLGAALARALTRAGCARVVPAGDGAAGDVLVVCASPQRPASLDAIGENEERVALRDLREALDAARSAMASMERRGGGRIVFVTPGWASPTAALTHGGLVALARSLAAEAPEGVTCNAVSGGVPLDEVAQLVAYLAGDEGALVSGQVFGAPG